MVKTLPGLCQLVLYLGGLYDLEHYKPLIFNFICSFHLPKLLLIVIYNKNACSTHTFS